MLEINPKTSNNKKGCLSGICKRKDSDSENEPLLPREDDPEQSPWGSLWIANVLCFFCAISFTLFMPTLWPYLHQIDPKTDQTFIGYVVAVFSIGQAISSPLFGYWSNKMQQTRIPAAAAISLMLISSILYCFIEAFPQSNRKWIMLVARFLCGLSGGVVALLRAYAATASTYRDRMRAITLVTGSFSLGMIVGPGIQMMFAPIGYPGVVLFKYFHLDIYTAGAFFSIIVDIILLICLFAFFKEHYAGIVPDAKQKDLPEIDIIAVITCFIAQFVMMCVITNLETVASPYSMIQWSWSNEQATTFNSLFMALGGIFSFLTYVIFAIKKDIANERIVAMAGFVLLLCFHILTFPYKFIPQKMHISSVPSNTSQQYPSNVWLNQTESPGFLNRDRRSATPTNGCTRDTPWCEGTAIVPVWLFAAGYIIFVGIGFPVINAPTATLFSKILGPRRQGTMQGFLLLSGSTARTIGPIIMMNCFTVWGPKPIWGLEIVLIAIGFAPWLIFWKRMVPLQVTETKAAVIA